MFARMALLTDLANQERLTPDPVEIGTRPVCSNPRCITHAEPYLPHTFRKSGDMLVCDYCEERTLLG